jgi:prepilin-type N-terminal cleavage/methylation domain-containing protein
MGQLCGWRLATPELIDLARRKNVMGNYRVRTRTERSPKERGFTFVEVLLAIVILLVGIVAVAQLVPASVGSNSANRNDSSALVFAQKEMDQFLNQPLNMTISPPAFIDELNNTCNLGDPTQPNTVQPNSSYVTTFYNQAVIDFTQAPVTGYSFTYQDPNDPFGEVYDVRWAVITSTQSGLVTSKRFIMGARKLGGNGIYRPVTLDTILER